MAHVPAPEYNEQEVQGAAAAAAELWLGGAGQGGAERRLLLASWPLAAGLALLPRPLSPHHHAACTAATGTSFSRLFTLWVLSCLCSKEELKRALPASALKLQLRAACCLT